MSKYESIKIGEIAEIKHVVTRSDIEKFIELTGDDNKLHCDETYTEKTYFKKPVAHGMLGASFISTVIGTRLPGDGALWYSQTLEFILPVRIEDELTIRVEVTKKIDKLNSIELKTDIFNQNKQKVTTGLAQVKIIEQENLITNNDILNKHVKNKIALVVGASGGIGSAVTKMLAQEGYSIAIHYNKNKEYANKLLKELTPLDIRTHIFQADITNPESTHELIAAIIRKFGDINIVINCSTIPMSNIRFENLEWNDLQKQLDINIKSNFFLTQSTTPHMEKNGYGKFIFISTQYTENKPPSQLLPYIVGKNALNGFAKSLAVELAPKGIQVNLVSPGMTETDLIANVPEKIRLITAANTPLGRLAKPEDIAGTICFLVSDRADYITGETIRVNGGQSML